GDFGGARNQNGQGQRRSDDPDSHPSPFSAMPVNKRPQSPPSQSTLIRNLVFMGPCGILLQPSAPLPARNRRPNRQRGAEAVSLRIAVLHIPACAPKPAVGPSP